jgi:hypothetical protein
MARCEEYWTLDGLRAEAIEDAELYAVIEEPQAAENTGWRPPVTLSEAGT